MDALVERFGEVQARFDELGGYALEARAREILAGLGFSQEVMDGDVGALSGGWKMRVALARILLMQPDAMLLDEPTNHLDLESILWLEGFLQGVRGRAADDLARSRVPEPHRRARSSRSTAASSPATRATTTSTSGSARCRGAEQAAQYERQQAMLAKEDALHRALQGAREPRRAGAVAREEARQDRAASSRRKRRKTLRLRVPAGAALGRGRREARRRATRRTARASSTTGLDLLDPPQRALVRDGRERRRQVDAAQAGRRRDRRPTRARVALGASVKLGYFAQHAMELLDRDADGLGDARGRVPARRRSARCATLAGCFGFSGDDVEKRCRMLSGGEKARLVLAQHALRPAELPGARRADQPPRHRHQGDARSTRSPTYEGTMLFVSHDRHFLRALSNRVLELGEASRASTAAATPSTSRPAATRRPACAPRADL